MKIIIIFFKKKHLHVGRRNAPNGLNVTSKCVDSIMTDFTATPGLRVVPSGLHCADAVSGLKLPHPVRDEPRPAADAVSRLKLPLSAAWMLQPAAAMLFIFAATVVAAPSGWRVVVDLSYFSSFFLVFISTQEKQSKE